MKPLAFLAPASLVLLLTCGSTAAAEPWQGAEPGITRTPELLQRFGKPVKQLRKGSLLVLEYRSGKALPRDARGVHFHVDPERQVLQRIDVFPKKPPTRALLEERLGPACTPSARTEDPCYEPLATADNRLALHYGALGMEVVFQGGRVYSLSYLEPDAPASKEEPAASVDALPPERLSPGDEGMTLRPATVVTEGSNAEPSPLGPAAIPTAAGADPKAIAGRVIMTDAPDAATRELGESRTKDPLSLGGIYYQRAELAGSRQQLTTSFNPTLPSLVDLFVDVTPSESVRSFVRGRLLYDPLDPTFSTPQIIMDQLWIKFDLADRVFVTAGRQHIKWGSSKVWNPTDFLRRPNPLPLDVFDLRTGVDMIKVNVPWEALASNLWFVATGDLNGPATQRLRYGGAVRAEIVLGPGELSLTSAFQQGRRPRYGLDWSMGLGNFDINTEVALVRDTGLQRWERTGTGFVPVGADGPKLQASLGVTTLFRVADIYRFQLRFEGFYNQLGYDDRSLLTWLRTTGDFQPLYFGRYYGLAQLTVNRRSAFEPMTALTLLGNVGDGSYLARLDVAVLPLREVFVSTFIEMPLGTRGGEFRFEPDTSVAELPGAGLSLMRAGLSVRIRM